MHWQRLDRDESVKVIDSVKSAENAGMFSITTSDVKRARLPYYKDYFLYQVTNFASLPSFSFEYLSDGKFFHHLDGTETAIFTVNDKGVLNLSDITVLDYLSFYLERVGDEDGEIILVNNPHDMPLLDSLDPAAYDAVFRQYKPPVIARGENGGFVVEADIYKDTQLLRATMTVSPKGRVTIKSHKMTIQRVADSGTSTAIF